MMLNNDSYGQWINGTIGRVKKFEKDEETGDVIVAELDNGETVQIAPYTGKSTNSFSKTRNCARKRSALSASIRCGWPLP